MKKVILATTNQGKAAEFKDIFSSIGIEIVSLPELGEPIPEIEETGDTFEANAKIKAEEVSKRFSQPVMSDDSGLEADALNGSPGVYSARYAGLEKNDQKNLEKVLEQLKGVEMPDRSARFVCVLALARPEKETIVKRGTCEGYIGLEEKGKNGFGYDPIFYPENMDRTLAELSPDEKNRISHRRHAIEKMLDYIKTNEIME
ncbi:XTP/dITP diphosphatase [Virgibacillus sp. MSP4-1]|uniref:XTP/dITP diphosphatase n=1 Tax=Virgibacillus sp. MSP4-1 TaxID=2700081 RepID=UPI00039DAD52|nr:XTP/dITP diphosphatase [Virgibacillus sp. MSP4-1]QHS22937.1 XTP/dITP diphosphatase [Virgibacillus sp. MSP4-1]